MTFTQIFICILILRSNLQTSNFPMLFRNEALVVSSFFFFLRVHQVLLISFSLDLSPSISVCLIRTPIFHFLHFFLFGSPTSSFILLISSNLSLTFSLSTFPSSFYEQVFDECICRNTRK